MTGIPDLARVVERVGAITGALVSEPDGAAVLRVVSQTCGELLEAAVGVPPD